MPTNLWSLVAKGSLDYKRGRGKEPTPPSFPQKRHCVVLKIPLRFSSTWNSTELCSSTISTQRTVSFWKNRKCQKGLQAVIKNSPISLIAQTYDMSCWKIATASPSPQETPTHNPPPTTPKKNILLLKRQRTEHPPFPALKKIEERKKRQDKLFLPFYLGGKS